MPPAEDDGQASRHVEEGLRYADEGNWNEALKSFRQAIAVNPRHANAHIHLGDAYLSSGKYEEAFAAYREAVRVAPLNPEAHYGLGAAYNDMAQYGDAFKPFVQAIRLAPDHAEAHYGIGYAYLKLENFKEAVVYLRRAVGLRPDYPEAHLSLGLTYLGLGQTKAAEQQLKVLEGLDAGLAKELDRELRSGAALARPTERPKADGPSADDASARGLGLGKSQPNNRETTGPTPPQQAAPNPRSRPPKAESDSEAAGGSIARPPRPARAAPAESQAASTASLLAVELSFWDSIKNSSDPAEFAAYLRKYPKGEFAELARIRLRAFEAKRGDAAAGQPAQPIAAESAAQPTPEPTPEPTPTPDPLAEALKSLRKDFTNRFTYKATAPGEDANVVSVTSEVVIEYEPLQFEGCRIEWRDTKDVLSVSLSDLDPLGVKVEERGRPNTTFSIPVWNLALATVGGQQAIREFKGDGSGAVNTYNGLDLQFADREKAEGLARLFRTAIKLCAASRRIGSLRPPHPATRPHLTKESARSALRPGRTRGFWRKAVSTRTRLRT